MKYNVRNGPPEDQGEFVRETIQLIGVCTVGIVILGFVVYALA